MIGVVILNYNTWQKTIECIESLLCSTQEYLCIVVDNCSTNDSFETIGDYIRLKKLSNFCVIRTEKNGGFSYGNNCGLDYLLSIKPDLKYVVFTNNDIIFYKDSLSNLVEIADKSNAFLVSPKILTPSLTPTNDPWIKEPSFMHSIGAVSNKKRMIRWDSILSPTKVYMTSGCCFLVRVDLFIKLGCFDENVFLYNEENILFYKASLVNYYAMVNPNAKVIHDHGSTTGRSNIFVDNEYIKSSMYYWRVYRKKTWASIAFLRCAMNLKCFFKKILRKYKNSQELMNFFKDNKRYYKELRQRY